MRSRRLSEQWDILRPRLMRAQAWLAAREWSRTVTLLLCVIAAVVIAGMVIRKAATGKELADLISALASLAWSLVPFAIMIWFGREIKVIALRIRKGKFLGQEFELLDELQVKTEVAEATSSKMVSATGSAAGTGSATAEGARVDGTAQDAIEEVLREAGRSPRLGLMLLSAKIERTAHHLANDVGLEVSRRPAPLSMLIRALVQAEQLTFEDAEALTLFNQVRNRIVHGHDADDDEVARAIDSGTRLLRLLLSRPRSRPQTPNESE